MTTTIVYPLIKSDMDIEIKYSLRSLDKWFDGDFEVVIIGYLPPYIDGSKVTHIKISEEPTNNRAQRTFNTYVKLSIACCMFREFLWMNDDIMLINHKQSIQELKQPKSSSNMATWSNNRISALTKGSPWRQFLWNTFQRLQYSGYPDVYWSELHIPQFVESEKMEEVFELFEDMPGEFLFYTAYLSVNEQEKPEQCDYKMRYVKTGPVGILEDRYKIINVTERSIKQQSTLLLLENSFPVKSKFEV